METIIVSLGKNSYPINIASGLIKDVNYYDSIHSGDKVVLVTNKTLAPIYLDKIHKSLTQLDITIDNIILPDGEKYKTLWVANQVITTLLKKSHGRDTMLIAIGGGVIGDLTGFIAAIYQRGINFIQIPTTLLSQVDASVGGKTAVNHRLGKNMIGVFYQPKSVIIDTDFLTSLPKREFSSGMAEVIKYGIILDNHFFCWLENNLDNLLRLDKKTLAYCIRRCCEIKATIIEKDEHESGIRALLNLGHTFAHSIEAYMGYGKCLHGEAVSVGIVIAAKIAEKLINFNPDYTIRIINLFMRCSLPTKAPHNMQAKDYIPYILRDKKNLNGKLRIVLPTSIGSAIIKEDIDHNIIISAINIAKK